MAWIQSYKWNCLVFSDNNSNVGLLFI